MLLTEYNEEIIAEGYREEGYDKGVEDGHRIGLEAGKRAGFDALLTLVHSGKLTFTEAADAAGISEEELKKYQK